MAHRPWLSALREERALPSGVAGSRPGALAFKLSARPGLAADRPEGWYPVNSRIDGPHWESDTIPIRAGERFRLRVAWTPAAQGQVLAHVYQYDQLNRLRQARGVEGIGAANTWEGVVDATADRYRSAYEYDANGNIHRTERWNRTGDRYDHMGYGYQSDADGRMVSVTLGPTTRAYTYDSAGRITSYLDSGGAAPGATAILHRAPDPGATCR